MGMTGKTVVDVDELLLHDEPAYELWEVAKTVGVTSVILSDHYLDQDSVFKAFTVEVLKRVVSRREEA